MLLKKNTSFNEGLLKDKLTSEKIKIYGKK